MSAATVELPGSPTSSVTASKHCVVVLVGSFQYNDQVSRWMRGCTLICMLLLLWLLLLLDVLNNAFADIN